MEHTFIPVDTSNKTKKHRETAQYSPFSTSSSPIMVAQNKKKAEMSKKEFRILLLKMMNGLVKDSIMR